MSRLIPLIDSIIRDDQQALATLAAALPQDELNSALLRCFMFSEDPSVLSVLLDAGANINHQDQEGRTAIFLAVKYNRADVVQILINRGCNVNLGKFNQSNCLHLAARRGNVEIVQMLIDAGHHRDVTNWGGNTAILIACRFGQTEIVERLLSYNCDVMIPNKLGHYPLHYAAFTGDRQLVSLLLQHGARADVRTHLGITPIMLACERKHCAVVELLSSCCDLSHREQLYGGNTLHWAVASGCCNCVKHLLTSGISIESTDLSGRTPLLQAIQSRHPEVITILLSAMGDQPMSGSNSVALHLAAALGLCECIEVLCKDTQSRHLVNARDCFGDTPLDLATAAAVTDDKPTPEIVDAIDALLRHGAERSFDGPIYCARSRVEVDQLGSLITRRASDDGSDAVRVMQSGECTEVNSNTDLLDNQDTEHEVVSHLVSHLQVAVNLACDTRSSCASAPVMSATCTEGLPPVFKTYSPVKMALIEMLRSASCEQMVAPVKFDFATWLDSGPEAFVLKVTSLDMTEWLYQRTHSTWSLRELCRGAIRRTLGYRAHEKVVQLPLPASMRDYLNMTELGEINTKDISIRSIVSYEDIDME